MSVLRKVHNRLSENVAKLIMAKNKSLQQVDLEI